MDTPTIAHLFDVPTDDRIYSRLIVKRVDVETRTITGIASTPTADRVGDVVEPKGAQFSLPLPFLWQHDQQSPIGQVIKARVTAEGIEITARLVVPTPDMPSQLAARLDEAWQSIKTGLVAGLSIGFRPISQPKLLDTGGLLFSKWEMFEVSAVTIPANREATILAIKSADHALRATSGQARTAVVTTKHSPAVAGTTQKPRVHIADPTRGVPAMATITEQIAAATAKRASIKQKMDAIVNKSLESGDTLDQDETDEYDEYKGEFEALSTHIKRLEDHAALDRLSARPIEDDTPKPTTGAIKAPVVVRNTQKLDKGIRFARYAMCLASSKGDLTLAKNIAEARFRDDEVINEVFKAAVAAGTTTDPTWAGALVAHNDLTTDFLEYLRPRTIIGQFGNGNIPSLRRVPFNVNIKGQTSGGSAGWVGEGYAKPVTKFDFDDRHLGWAKVAGISVITEELARFSAPGAEGLVRDGLADAVIERIDTDFIDPDKAAGTGANASPASITNGITAIVSSGSDAEAVRADIARLWAVADATNLPITSAVYITDSRTARMLTLMRNPLGTREFPGVSMTGGTIDEIPLIVSNYVPSDSSGSMFILAFASEILLADDDVVTLTASREASILMDSAPNMNSGTPTAAQLVSMFQTNSIALRAERYINWARRRPQAVAYLTGVNWGAGA